MLSGACVEVPDRRFELEHLDTQVAALATMKAHSLLDIESLVMVETALALSFLQQLSKLWPCRLQWVQ